MTEESMAWLGAAVYLKGYGATDEQAAELAGVVLAVRAAEAAATTTERQH